MSSKLFHIYFGGTFDPPHRGHFDILCTLARDEWVTHIYLSPTHINPLKDLSTQTQAVGTAAERLEWIKLWLKETAKVLSADQMAKIELYTGEIEKGAKSAETPSFTVDTVEELMQANDPEHRFRWAIALGSDSLAYLDRWKEIKHLLAMTDGVWVFRRGDEALSLKAMSQSLLPLTSWRLFPQSIFNISSSEVRASLQTSAIGGNALTPDALVPSVRDAVLGKQRSL